MRSIFRKESTWDRLRRPLTRVGGGPTVKRGLTAGAGFLVVSAASAVASAARRREEHR